MPMNRFRLPILLLVLALAPQANAEPPVVAPVAEGPPLIQDNASGLPFSGGFENGQNGPADPTWVDAEYLLWWMRGQTLPALATTSPATTNPVTAGVLGETGTRVLFGNREYDNGARSGARLSAGSWLDNNQTLGVEADFLFLADKSVSFSAASNGSTYLLRPFVNAQTAQPAALSIGAPGNVSGSIGANVSTTDIYGAGFLLRETLGCCENFRIDLVGGYRFLRFSDELSITSNLTSINPNSPTGVVLGTDVAATDRFGAQNTFNGFGLGLAGEYWNGPLGLQLMGRVTAGLTQEGVDVDGISNIGVPGSAPVVNSGGLLTQSSNINHYSKIEGSVVSEINCKAVWEFTPNLRTTVGYTLMIWDDVVRAADVVDLRVNPSLLPGNGPLNGPANPAFTFRQNNLYLQGLTLGLEMRF
jgi:Putative beta barrel porin-7 (BBP7)